VVIRTRFHALLEQEINIKIEQIKDEMANGIGDNLKYWYSVGMIAGLRGALTFCDDIERDLGNDPRPTEPEGD